MPYIPSRLTEPPSFGERDRAHSRTYRARTLSRALRVNRHVAEQCALWRTDVVTTRLGAPDRNLTESEHHPLKMQIWAEHEHEIPAVERDGCRSDGETASSRTKNPTMA